MNVEKDESKSDSLRGEKYRNTKSGASHFRSNTPPWERQRTKSGISLRSLSSSGRGSLSEIEGDHPQTNGNQVTASPHREAPHQKGVVRHLIDSFLKHDILTLSGALAFYAALALAPIILLLIWGASLIPVASEEELVNEMVTLAGPGAGETIATIIKNSQEKPHLRSIAGLFGFGALLFTASGFFAQLQYSLNRIWEVRIKPNLGWSVWIRKRLVSASMVFAISALLVVSLVGTTVFVALHSRLESAMPTALPLLRIFNWAGPFVVFTLLFAVVFSYLPDVRIGWASVWLGAAITALLFTIGKELIAIYLGRSGVASTFGAAGSLFALLVWVYYSSVIVFLGAEITQIIARRRGNPPEPENYAVRQEG